MPEQENVLDGLISFDIPSPITEEETTDFPPVPQVVTEIEEEEPPAGETEDTTDEETDITPSEENETAGATFSLFREFEFIKDEDIPEKPTIEDVRGLKVKIRERALEDLVEASPKLFQDVLVYVHSKANVSKKDLLEFLAIGDDNVQVPTVETAEQAESFLKGELSQHRLYKDNPDGLQLYLDSLDDERKLKLAKSYVEEIETAAAKDRQAKIDAAKYEKAQQEQRQAQFVNDIFSNIEQSGWTKKKQDETKSTFARLAQYNEIIQSDPGLYAQYLNLMSTFDPNKKQFDTTKFELRKNTEQINKVKTAIETDAVTSIINKFKSAKPASAGSRDGLKPVP